jgi:hypothetical protein
MLQKCLLDYIRNPGVQHATDRRSPEQASPVCQVHFMYRGKSNCNHKFAIKSLISQQKFQTVKHQLSIVGMLETYCQKTSRSMNFDVLQFFPFEFPDRLPIPFKIN